MCMPTRRQAAEQVDLVGNVGGVRLQREERTVRRDAAQALARQLMPGLAKLQHRARGAVDRGQPAAGVHGDHAFVDGFERRVLLPHQAGDVQRLQVEHLPLDAVGEQPGAAKQDERDAQQHREEGHELGAGAVLDMGLETPHRQPAYLGVPADGLDKDAALLQALLARGGGSRTRS